MDWDPRQARLSLLLFLVIVTVGMIKVYLTRPVYPDPALYQQPWPPAGCLVDASVLRKRALEAFPDGTTVASAVEILGLETDPTGSGFCLPRAGILRKGLNGWQVRAMTQAERWIWRIPMDIHRADPQDLSRIDGIGSTLASRINSYVREKKCLQSLDELLDVPGIGRSRLEKLKEELDLR
jgi:hypothetical protein